ncbi:hypothetical protein P152DRAFT_16783 [Eremomyces bilateralis CBS 781.70]|uniref:Uncharacterized protein n=1 Tax=Eremomyces bilateralis CBS 781.70 TaxID=1392243 RepID=A0A6G1GHF2_9PEZI|nr:uncharacterized protein P152DRAFT_16783 [Eremomyces bilateralis CBS 781.70]KAF1817366.1 hypothetical protein P152DRAFT_16783 [Eremomyces bilateralis CBS 781.70]
MRRAGTFMIACSHILTQSSNMAPNHRTKLTLDHTFSNGYRGLLEFPVSNRSASKSTSANSTLILHTFLALAPTGAETRNQSRATR